MLTKLCILIMFLQCGPLLAEICQTKLRALAENQKEFVRCSTMNSVPVNLCIGCELSYTDMIVAYQSLSNEKNCSNKYFDKDRINIVSTTQSILIGLWTKAYCDDCFTGNNAGVFDTKYSALDLCLKAEKKTPCIVCLEKYQDLNDFYKHLDQHNDGKVCYDMQDKMNRTRVYWSNGLNCCKRPFDLVLFLFASVLFGLVPVVFYGGIYAYGKRRERNHGVINADPETIATANTSAIATTSGRNHAAVVNNTVSQNEAPLVKPNPEQLLRYEDDSTSDESDNNMLKKKESQQKMLPYETYSSENDVNARKKNVKPSKALRYDSDSEDDDENLLDTR